MTETLNFYEIFDKSKLQYIIDNYDDIKENIKPSSTDTFRRCGGSQSAYCDICAYTVQ